MAPKKDAPPRKFIAQNRKARHNYFIVESFEAGIMLAGSEVKSLRVGGVSLDEAWAGPKEGALWLFNCYIPELKHASWANHESKRPRKLLLRRKEMIKMIEKIQQKGTTLVPLSLYFTAKGLVKLELGIATGKKQHDKRASEKEKDWNREKSRILREHNRRDD